MMQPGDLIEWTYRQTGDLVFQYEMLWSTPMNRWVPIGSGLVHTLISISDEQITWLNENGCFHARVDNALPGQADMMQARVLPRARG